MARSTEPQHRAIFWVDIAGSSALSRTDLDRHNARAGMYRALRRAFRRARLPWSTWNNRFGRHREDRGDGVFCLVPPSVPKSRLVAALPALESALEAHNRDAPEGASIRLRVALHAGEVHFDPEGVSGNAMDYTARLLDAPEFKGLFAASGSCLGVIASDWFYQNVIHQNPEHQFQEYRRTAVTVRGAGPPEAYVRLFPRSAPPEEGSRRLPAAPRPVRAAVALAVLAVPLAAAPGEAPVAACAAPPVQVKVRVSTEKEAIVRGLALEFERGTRGPDGCRRADVNVVSASYPGGAREALHQGWLTRDPKEVLDEADVWLPDSSLEVEQVREALRRNRIGTVRLEVKEPVATSRLVVAVPAAMADDLGLSGNTVTWDDVLGWPGRGYSFGRASPRASSVGLVATVALYQAALGASVLDEKALTGGDAAGRLHAVEQAIAREDDEPGKLLCAMREAPPGGGLRRTALLVSEKSVIDYLGNAPLDGGGCGPGAPGKQPELRPFYVGNGMPLFDHPFVTITRAQPPGAARRQIIDAFHRRLRQPDAQARLQDAGYRDASGTTTAWQDAIPSLLPGIDLAGKVHDEPLLDAWNKARKSARVLFAVDVSRSMAAPFPYIRGDRVSAAADAIGLARPLMGARDEIGLWEFADGIDDGDGDHRSLVPVGPPDPDRIERLTDRLAGLGPTGHGPGLLPAVRAAVREMREDDADPDETTRAVIMLAHGAGTGSGTGNGAAELAGELSRGDPVRVYVIAFHPESCAAGLDRGTQAAGGACYEIDGMTAMRRALDGIATGLWGTPCRDPERCRP
ncbi:substrate-binding domain-containing protein [Spirillospora sp. CA-255316]